MSDNSAFVFSKNLGFGVAVPEDDLLHPDKNSQVADVSCTETQYFGFSVPEEKIHALCYLWHHPVLKVLSGGVWVWQGNKLYAPMSEIYDWRGYMDDSAIADDLYDVKMDNGYTVKVIDPLEKIQIGYHDQSRKNFFEIEFTAVAEPVMFGDGNHFEQALKAKGNLTLRGKDYKVDCYTVRDRSWGKPREETPMSIPPVSWMSCAFNDSFAFNCNLLDDARHNTELKGTPFDVPEKDILNSGWIYKDGQVSRLVRGSKKITRDNRCMFVKEVEFEVDDDSGNNYRITGKTKAISASNPWPNILGTIAMMEWECNGITGYGDCQEGLYTDYLNRFCEPF